jgi:hypothetical protein
MLRNLQKSNGLNFKMCQQKILFYLTTLNLTKFLTKKTSKLSDDEYNHTIIAVMNARMVCKNCILNGLNNILYNEKFWIGSTKLNMLTWKIKSIAKKINGKCLICNKTRHEAKDYKNKSHQGNLKGGRTVQANVTKVNNLLNKVSNISLFMVVFEVNLFNNHEW